MSHRFNLAEFARKRKQKEAEQFETIYQKRKSELMKMDSDLKQMKSEFSLYCKAVDSCKKAGIAKQTMSLPGAVADNTIPCATTSTAQCTTSTQTIAESKISPCTSQCSTLQPKPRKLKTPTTLHGNDSYKWNLSRGETHYRQSKTLRSIRNIHGRSKANVRAGL